jgi:phage tail sheath protein FI
MTVMTSWPGVYIQELPSLVHSVQPAPTSIAVFAGYTHPFLTQNFGVAVQLNSFADYQANFGGFFYAPWQPDYVGQAVYQFFNNGGPTCYVVGLNPGSYYEYNSATPPVLEPVGTTYAASVTILGNGSDGFVFTARQPVAPSAGVGVPMQVMISNLLPASTPTQMDIVISYGSVVETYRAVTIATFLAALQNSQLVTASFTSTAPTELPSSAGSSPLSYGTPASGQAVPAADYTVIYPPDFGAVFDTGGSLDKVPVFNLLALPGISDPAVASAAVAFCERKRAFYIMDTPSSSTAATSSTAGWDANSVVGVLNQSEALDPAPQVSTNAAVYYPWLQVSNPITSQPQLSPPSGFVAGIYGQTDASSGVWQSPAGIQTSLNGTAGVDPNGLMTDPQQGVMNQNAIDCLRQFPGVGTVVFGARTTAGADANTAQQQWKYVAVRRTALFIEQSLYSSLTWAIFQPNATPLWNALTQEVSAFMLTLYRQGAFAGDTPSQAFLVQCDATTTTPTDVQNGIVNVLVGYAPLLPAEFVIIKIAQLAGQAQS